MKWNRIGRALLLCMVHLWSASPGRSQDKADEIRPNAAAAPPIPALGAPILADTEPGVLWTRLSVRANAGDGVGYTRGFTAAEAMVPLWENGTSLVFADLRVVNFMQQNQWEYNVGAGYRWFSPALNRILGINSFFDSRKTDAHGYQQIGVGFEALSPSIEFRVNGYFIAGAAHRDIADSGFVSQGIVNNLFVFQRATTTEVAMGGMDAEIGGRLPFLDKYVPRAYVGYYNYAADGIAVTHGARFRFEAQLSQRVLLHFSVQNDRLFDTTVNGGLTFAIGAPAYRAGTGPATWTDVMRQRVQRDVNVVISQQSAVQTITQPVPPPPPPPPEELR